MEAGTVAGDLPIRILADLVDDIQAETGNALFHPEADALIQFFSHGGIFPVQIRLLHGKLVEIPSAHFRRIGPGRAAEGGAHGIGRCLRIAVAPDEEIVIGIIPTLQCFQKPRMLIRAMVQHQIHNNADAPLLALGNQRVHILHGAKERINGAIVGNVITVIHLRGCAHRTQPDRVNAQLLQIVQSADDAAKVADTITIGILKAFGIQLIKNCRFPPASFFLVQQIHS